MLGLWSLSALSALSAVASASPGSVWPNGHERILAGMASSDVAERRSASGRLLELPSATAVEWARTALRDTDIEVRLHGARTTTALRLERAGDEVVSWLQEREVRLRAAACEVIRVAPTPESVAALARVLSDAKPEVRELAAQAMGSSGYLASVSPLLGHLDDPTLEVRIAVLRALGRLGDAGAAVPVFSKLQDAEPEVRTEAARTLGRLRERQAVPSLELALADPELAVRLAALDALGEIGAPSSVPGIAAVLAPANHGANGDAAAHADDAVREAALRALSRTPVPEALTVLVAQLLIEGPLPFLDDAAAPVRRSLKAVGQAVEPALIAVLNSSPSARQVSAAALALAVVASPATAPAAVQAVVSAARRGAAELRVALQALERMGHPSALPFILEHLEDAEPSTRELCAAVAAALIKPSVPDGRAIDIVAERVTDRTTPLSERLGLIRLLGRTGTAPAASLLLSLLPASQGGASLATDRVPLRVAVLDALGDTGVVDPKVELLLLASMDHPAERVRVAGARALARLGRDSAAKVLLQRIEAAAEQDRNAMGMAVSGALAHATEPSLVARGAAALRVCSAPLRDAVLEGLGRSKVPGATAAISVFAHSLDPDDRRKVAEAMAGRADGYPTLELLAQDADASVRANAMWSLGFLEDEVALAKVRAGLSDKDVAVAGNSAISLARLAVRFHRGTESSTLCAALEDRRSYVVLESLVGLRLLLDDALTSASVAVGSCPSGVIRQLLGNARTPHVRAAAAVLLQDLGRFELPAVKPAREAALEARRLDRLALQGCLVDERNSKVARACGSSVGPLPTLQGKNELTVYVAADGLSEPTPRTPFALLLPDGSLRLGNADRRGAVFERAVADGMVELAVPAPRMP